MRLAVIVAVISAGCGAHATTSREHRFANNWGNALGCTPKGDELTIIGAVAVRPFGKGVDGAVIATDTGTWVVSYNAGAELRELDGRRVRARGHACDKRGEAIVGKHLDLESLTEL
jgi:hypothetical protein